MSSTMPIPSTPRARRGVWCAWPGLVAALAVGLAGCGSQLETVTPEAQATMMTDLQAGKQRLECTLNCVFTWNSQVSSIQGLDLAEKWNDLTVKVMQIGYGNDLAYYYLGQAAQGLGYHQAAIDYYRYALALSTGSNSLLKCEPNQMGAGDTCQGVDLANAIPQLIQASQNVLDQQALQAQQAAAPPPPVRRHHYHKPTTSLLTPPPPSPVAPATPGMATPPPPTSP